VKRVRISIAPPDAYLPPVYELLTVEADYLDRVRIVNWNVAEPPVGFLLHVEGAYDRLEDPLAAHESVREYGLVPDGEAAAYLFLAAAGATVGRALFENFTRRDLLTVPPVECHDDGSSTFTLVGSDAAIQAAVDGVPDGVAVTVEAVGGSQVAPDDAVGALAPRQRAAVEAALEVGYYDVPRAAGTEAVARKLGCATATASEHLRKAESTVLARLFDR
jgi:hypothetical protein